MHYIDERMADKVDTEDFDALRLLFTSVNSSQSNIVLPPSMISTKDSNYIKDMRNRLNILEDNLQSAISSKQFSELLQKVEVVESLTSEKAANGEF